MWRRDRDPEGRELVADCEAFLAGSYAERLKGLGRRVPVWAWTNLLAHGTEEDLRLCRLSSGEGRSSGPGLWCPARSYLAGEVLDIGHRRPSLARLQIAVLIPLELELAARRDAVSWRPGEWVAAVLSVLGERRRTGPRP
jgi:hypothetical protein